MSELDLYPVLLTPEMNERVSLVINDVIQLLKDKTQTPEEALMALDGAIRRVAATHNIFLVRPIDDPQVGHT